MENKEEKKKAPVRPRKRVYTRRDAVAAKKTLKKAKRNAQIVEDEPLEEEEHNDVVVVEEEDDKPAAVVLDKTLVTQLMNTISDLSARVDANQRKRPPPQVVVSGSYNWTTTDRNVKMAQAILQTVSGFTLSLL